MPLSIEEWKQRFDQASGDDTVKCRALLAELSARLIEERWMSRVSAWLFYRSSSETSEQLARRNKNIEESEAIERALRDASKEYQGKEKIKTLIFGVAKALGGASQLTPGSETANALHALCEKAKLRYESLDWNISQLPEVIRNQLFDRLPAKSALALMGTSTLFNDLDPFRRESLIQKLESMRVKRVYFGRYGMTAITGEGQLIEWGGNSLTPKKVSLPLETSERVKSLQVNPDTSAVVTNTGRLLMWGYSGFGQLGMGNTDPQVTPRVVPLLLQAGETIQSLHTTRWTSAVVTSTGRLLMWGSNNWGQLGMGNTDFQVTPRVVPLLLQAGETIQSLHTTCATSAVVTSTGRLLMWGDNQFGQLGMGNTDFQVTPRVVPLLLQAGETIQSLHTTETTSAVVTSTGSLLMWGDNQFGQLGMGNTDFQVTPRVVPLLLQAGETIQSLHTTCATSAVVTSTGRLLMWGRNQWGQLGMGNTDPQVTPRVVPLPLQAGETIQSLHTTGETSAVVTSTGRLLMWGRNQWGQLGMGHTVNQATPRVVPLPLQAGETIQEFTMVGESTFATTSTGRVFVWGNNRNGRLGVENMDKITTPHELPYFSEVQEKIEKLKAKALAQGAPPAPNQPK